MGVAMFNIDKTVIDNLEVDLCPRKKGQVGKDDGPI
jgi:hypothetical protein